MLPRGWLVVTRGWTRQEVSPHRSLWREHSPGYTLIQDFRPPELWQNKLPLFLVPSGRFCPEPGPASLTLPGLSTALTCSSTSVAVTPAVKVKFLRGVQGSLWSGPMCHYWGVNPPQLQAASMHSDKLGCRKWGTQARSHLRCS